MSFLDYPSAKKLAQLSKNPIDLSKKGSFTPERIKKLRTEALGFQLFYGAERVTDDTLNALFSLAREAKVMDKMQAMQSGKIINEIHGYESEKRSVLHTAMRDFFDHPQKEKEALQASKLAYAEYEKLDKFLKKTKSRFTDIVQIGIGGSDLGPRALAIALTRYHLPNRRAHFISNVDPDDAAAIFNALNLKKTLVVVVSKSGSTLETLTNETIARHYLKKAGLNPKNHIVAVTGKGSPMDDPKLYLGSFYIWDYVGGRYSATSMVGGVTLAFLLGMKGYTEILKGAHEMDYHALTAKPESNLPLISAILGIWNRNFLHLPTVAIIPYSQALSRFPAHLQQLDMESNGKRIDKEGNAVPFETGPIIWGEPGTNGQHSFYQLIHQGTTTVPLELIGFKKTQYGQDLKVQGTTSQKKLLANLFAQSIALATGQQNPNPNRFFPGNRPNRVLLAERLDARTLGKLLAYYEHKVAFQGFIWGINSFDQEGVQLGKVLAKEIINLYAGKKSDFELGKAYLTQS
ncbi:MAG TPA: glucose-6-phosphate isomerase [Chlamydiales bacterium]|nr:glucose-6-phosphate isomerase [Chlamydiales bacterium]